MTAPTHPSSSLWGVLRLTAAGSLVALAISLGMLPLFGSSATPEVLLGWLLSVLSGLAHAWISWRAAVPGHPKPYWGLVMNILRLGAVLAIMLAVFFRSSLQAPPFGLSLVAGTAILPVVNALAISRASAKGNST